VLACAGPFWLFRCEEDVEHRMGSFYLRVDEVRTFRGTAWKDRVPDPILLCHARRARSF